MKIGRGRDRYLTDQMRRAGVRQEILRRPVIRLAGRTDFAVGPGQRGRPFHAIIAVRRFMDQRVIFPLRGVAATGILHDHRVAPWDKIIDVVQRCRSRLIIRHPHEYHRAWVCGIRPMHVGIQRHAVAHPRREIGFDHHTILRLAQRQMFGHRLGSSLDAGLRREASAERLIQPSVLC